MRLLLDNNLSARLCDLLARESWDVVHVRDLGLQASTDRDVMAAARDDNRILSAQTPISVRYLLHPTNPVRRSSSCGG